MFRQNKIRRHDEVVRYMYYNLTATTNTALYKYCVLENQTTVGVSFDGLVFKIEDTSKFLNKSN